MRHIVIGLTLREAQGYAIERLRGEQPISIMSADRAAHGGLHGLGSDTTIHALPRCTQAREGVALYQQLSALRARGVEIKTGEQ